MSQGRGKVQAAWKHATSLMLKTPRMTPSCVLALSTNGQRNAGRTLLRTGSSAVVWLKTNLPLVTQDDLSLT